jgi:hypothetical protein
VLATLSRLSAVDSDDGYAAIAGSRFHTLNDCFMQ